MLMMLALIALSLVGAIDIGDFYGTGNAYQWLGAGTNIDVTTLFGNGTHLQICFKIFNYCASIAINGNNIGATVSLVL